MSSNSNTLPNLLVFPEDRQLVGLSNWAVYRDHLKSVARSTGLGGYLDGTITAPTPPAAPAPNVAPVGPVVTPINSRSPSATSRWPFGWDHLSELTREYDTTSAAAQSLAKERIQQYRYTPGTPFEEYFKQLEALRKAASDVGCTVTDEDLHSRFLPSLSTEYLWILQTHGA
ncbi:hypothetical protein GYMLUDRAFT_244152 [Collybiopsis luxurians FD-317 M1]|uniref:Uncharacterized protein n=1 Tax=Collybiopsis luxurians FD-317 M1 TaxID=944289 RepID=A0A0D0CWS0_9AGAR|nr:hypothetical protein GYMLUDRAFT_244152 [Collybiopsis luxurians FD-317 M1]